MADLATFSKRIRQHALNVSRNANLIVREVALRVDEVVVDKTPVDRGIARSNWQASVGAPAAGVLPAYAPGKGGSTGAANSSAAKAQAAAAVVASRPGDSIHITNNAGHIGKLNDGGSRQAPAGFVEDAVLEGILAVKAANPIVTGHFSG